MMRKLFRKTVTKNAEKGFGYPRAKIVARFEAAQYRESSQRSERRKREIR